MTGQELINWIQENNAEDLKVVVFGLDRSIEEATSVSIIKDYGIMIEE